MTIPRHETPSKKELTRQEYDLLGEIDVPARALYGAQTRRAVENFPACGQRTLEDFPYLVRSLLLVKKAAAMANLQAGLLPKNTASAIIRAADEMLANGWAGQFPIHFLHGGGGTSANMNANEVLANLAEELQGGKRGNYRLVHPNDHVNLHQSTNDVYPTTCHMAVLSQWQSLDPLICRLAAALKEKSDIYQNIIRLARTCYQDAVEITFQDYLGGMAQQIARLAQRLALSVSHLHNVNLGGTICGRSQDVPPAYFENVLDYLKLVTGDPAFCRAENLFDAAQNPDDMAGVSAALDLLARSLIKIAQDLRVLSSGPQSGLGELRLPPVQPGSSIMPGKINPVIPEFLIQVCFRVMGNHAMCAAGLDHGELDLNVWESSMVFPILESMGLLEQAITTFIDKCIQGLEPVVETNRAHANTIIARLAYLTRHYGYSRVNAVCCKAQGDKQTLDILLQQEFQ